MKVYFDFETRSTADLRKTGAHVYAADPTTNVLCLAWAIDDGPVHIYRPFDGDLQPTVLFEAINQGATCYAHNAQFDRLIWHHVCVGKYGWPPMPIRNLRCSMVMAYAMGLQGSLENAAHCVGLDVNKDMKGNRVMLQLAKPRRIKDDGTVVWWERKDSTPKLDINAKYEMVYKYAMQDIVVMRELIKRLLPLDPFEQNTWILDQAINDRGVHIDEPAAANAIYMAELEAKFLNRKMQKLTRHSVASCNAHTALRQWVNRQGVETESVDKASVKDLLDGHLPKKVRDVLEVRQNAAKSSVNKINRMLDSLDVRGRSQGCFQFNGAASTGRWAGRRIQLQNLPRPSIRQSEIEDVLERLGSCM